MVKITLIL